MQCPAGVARAELHELLQRLKGFTLVPASFLPQLRSLSRYFFKVVQAAKSCTTLVSCYLWEKPEDRKKVPAHQLFPSKVSANFYAR